jgi:hypothetical protein
VGGRLHSLSLCAVRWGAQVGLLLLGDDRALWASGRAIWREKNGVSLGESNWTRRSIAEGETAIERGQAMSCDS